MDLQKELFQFNAQQMTRRAFLGRNSAGVGALSLALLQAKLSASSPENNFARGVVNPLHFPKKAKRVIYLSMAGGPSHLETFDPKPKLAAMHDQAMPESMTKGKQIAQLQKLIVLVLSILLRRLEKMERRSASSFPTSAPSLTKSA